MLIGREGRLREGSRSAGLGGVRGVAERGRELHSDECWRKLGCLRRKEKEKEKGSC